MVNKVRKKDGSMKYPYQLVLPFIKVEELLTKLRSTPHVKCAYRDNKSYGTYLWGYTAHQESYEEALAVFREYFPDFKVKSEYAYIDTYHNSNSLSFHIYIAYAEFDKEV